MKTPFAVLLFVVLSTTLLRADVRITEMVAAKAADRNQLPATRVTARAQIAAYGKPRAWESSGRSGLSARAQIFSSCSA